MGHATRLAPEQQRALDLIKNTAAARGLYLAGGSAIAFHLGHRRSLDIDLFSLTVEFDLEQLRESFREQVDRFEVLEQTNVALHMRLEDALVAVVRYPYPPLEKPQPGPRQFPVAGLRDLAAMKLAAIARRGIRRDFWDLQVICSGPLPLVEAGKAYCARFGKAQPDLYHVFRSLTYFDDAEKEPTFPSGLDGERWEQIKGFFRQEARRVLLDPGESG